MIKPQPGIIRMAVQASCILINHSSQLTEGLDEQAERRLIRIAAPVSGSIAATPAASALAILDAKRAGPGPGGQVAEHYKRECAGELMLLFGRDLFKAAG